MTDLDYRSICWRAMLMFVKAFGQRYGFCDDIKVIKSDIPTRRIIVDPERDMIAGASYSED